MMAKDEHARGTGTRGCCRVGVPTGMWGGRTGRVLPCAQSLLLGRQQKPLHCEGRENYVKLDICS